MSFSLVTNSSNLITWANNKPVFSDFLSNILLRGKRKNGTGRTRTQIAGTDGVHDDHRTKV